MNQNKAFNNAVTLSEASLGLLTERISVPAYQREQLKPSIVHIGVGNFHRAHQAVYLDELAGQGISYEWGERGIGLLPGDKNMAEALIPQNCLYTVVERGAEKDKARIIGSLKGYIFAPSSPETALAALTDPATRIVSLTITEGGYNISSLTGDFDASHPAIKEDLQNSDRPKTVFGYLSEALARRRHAGLAPFTVMSCDNLQGNGQITRNALIAFARLRDEQLANWIEANVAFPNAMVDRITPQTTDSDRELVTAKYGIKDAWPVMTEPFRQWVLEDTFCNGRPPLEQVGVQLVSNVQPYETMKLRLLNASHQAMGYLGYLAGYRYIHEVMSDNDFWEFIRRLMDEEVTPLLPPVPGINLAEYKKTLLERFANPKIRDQVTRICTDGSDRMPKFLLPSLSHALAEGHPHHWLTLAVAGWMRYLRGVDEQGEVIPLTDPRAQELQMLAEAGKNDPRPLLSLRQLFGNLGDNQNFVTELAAALAKLDTLGAKAALQAFLAAPSA